MQSNIWYYPRSHKVNISIALQWRHNERDGVSYQLHLYFLLSPLFRRRSKETSRPASLASVGGIHRWPVWVWVLSNAEKSFHLMTSSWWFGTNVLTSFRFRSLNTFTPSDIYHWIRPVELLITTRTTRSIIKLGKYWIFNDIEKTGTCDSFQLCFLTYTVKSLI